MPDEGTVLLVESDERQRDRLGEALMAAGYEVMVCQGPTAPDYTCIGDREGSCPLLERADVVVFDTWLAGDDAGVGTSSEELLEMYASSGRTVVAVGSVAWGRVPFAAGHVIRLDEHPEPRDVVNAVRTAPDVEGFVLRRPFG